MTGLPGGLSAMIAKQLERQMGVAAGDAAQGAPLSALPARVPGRSMSGVVTPLPAAAAAAAPAAGAPGGVNRTAGAQSTGATRQAQFVQQHTEAARIAEQHTGIPAEFMVAQAAHESGWGRREIRHSDGSSAHNLFGIKAGPGWKGKTATVTTTEYVDGQPVKTQAKFRAYDSYAASFADYAAMMKTSPRYAKVVANADTAQDFAKGLQRAGYATDPAYADKLTRVIHTTLRLQRTQA
jgi:flagellar protein FlgJ